MTARPRAPDLLWTIWSYLSSSPTCTRPQRHKGREAHHRALPATLRALRRAERVAESDPHSSACGTLSGLWTSALRTFLSLPARADIRTDLGSQVCWVKDSMTVLIGYLRS